MPNSGRTQANHRTSQDVLDFRHVAPFWNENDSHATGSKIEAKCRTFWYSDKTGERDGQNVGVRFSSRAWKTTSDTVSQALVENHSFTIYQLYECCTTQRPWSFCKTCVAMKFVDDDDDDECYQLHYEIHRQYQTAASSSSNWRQASITRDGATTVNCFPPKSLAIRSNLSVNHSQVT